MTQWPTTRITAMPTPACLEAAVCHQLPVPPLSLPRGLGSARSPLQPQVMHVFQRAEELEELVDWDWHLLSSLRPRHLPPQWVVLFIQKVSSLSTLQP